MLKRALAAAMAMFAASFGEAAAQSAAEHYHWRAAAANEAPRPWAVLLPGSGGLSVLGDDEHYFRAAAWLNARGVDALVIDYHRAARFVAAARDGEAGPRMAAIVADALTTQRSLGRMAEACPGTVIGWSLGGEGAWALAAASERDPALAAVAMFYPTVRAAGPYRNTLPVLVLQGEADNVTPARELNAFVAARAPDSAPLDVRSLTGAAHGFDVVSLDPPRSMRFPPLVGRRATFGYDARASEAAMSALEQFLRERGVIGAVC